MGTYFHWITPVYSLVPVKGLWKAWGVCNTSKCNSVVTLQCGLDLLTCVWDNNFSKNSVKHTDWPTQEERRTSICSFHILPCGHGHPGSSSVIRHHASSGQWMNSKFLLLWIALVANATGLSMFGQLPPSSDTTGSYTSVRHHRSKPNRSTTTFDKMLLHSLQSWNAWSSWQHN